MESPTFTQAEYHVFELYQKLVARTSTFAVDWDSNVKKLTCTPSTATHKWATTLVYWLSCALMVLHAGNGLHDLILAMAESRALTRSEGGSSSNILRHGFQVSYAFICPGYIVVVLWNVCFWWGREENVNAFNQLLAYGRKNGLEMRLTTRTKYFGYFQKAFWGAITFSMVAIVATELGVLASKRNYSRIPLVLYTPLFGYIIAILLAFYQAIVYVFLVICYEKLTPSEMNAWKSVPTLCTATENYRTLILLSNQFNQSICRLFIPLTKYAFVCIGMVIFALAIRVNPTDLPGVVIKSSCFVIPLYLYGAAVLAGNMMSSVWYLGRTYLRQLEHRTLFSPEIDPESKKLLLKTIRSLSPIRVKVGVLYYMEREAKLTLMNFIAIGTVNVLLVLSNK